MWKRNARPKIAAILLGEQTQHLLRELFPDRSGEAGLFDGFAPVERRIVLWGDAPAPLDLPHRGVVAPEDELLRRLWLRVPALDNLDPQQPEPACWRIQSSPDYKPEGLGPGDSDMDAQYHFGSREARVAQVELKDGSEASACWVESLAAGWLFLLACGEGLASLIAVGDSVERLLAGSRLIAPRVLRTLCQSAPVPAYPRMRRILANDQTIFCGTAAMSFDPLCGEGAGNAVRGAFLAAALVRAARAGAGRDELANHYRARLTQGFLRHLQLCLQFYSTGGFGAMWRSESDALRRGIELLSRDLKDLPPPRFALVDRELIAL